MSGLSLKAESYIMPLAPRPRAGALLSECMTLDVGGVLVMGTPAGVGKARKPPVWMKDANVIEIEIERIGLLRKSGPRRGAADVATDELARSLPSHLGLVLPGGAIDATLEA
jgi:hypothetical protein